jgi:hypothetical protein
MENKNNAKKLTAMLGMGSLNGAVPIAALSGLFRIENAVLIAILFMAGPGAILTAILLDGAAKQRMLAALFAGLIATIMVIFAAGIGPKLLGFVNLNIIKIAGAISIGVIAIMIAGVKIPDNVPFGIMLAGILIGAIWR